MARHRDVRNRNFSYDEIEADFYDEDEEDAACEEHRQHMLSSRGGSTRDADLVAAIAVELESRLGKGRFSGEQVHQAVVSSGYEIDTAQAILVSSSESHQVQFTTSPPSAIAPAEASGGQRPGAGIEVGPPSGLPPDPSGQEGSSPSALAFGLCVDHRDDWRRRAAAAASGTNGALAPPPPSDAGGGGARTVAPGGASVDEVERFGFDTPSPDDVNLAKQATARGGIGSGGVGVGGGGGGGGSRKAGPSTGTFSSPKANVVHISGSTPEISAATRKSVNGAAAAVATPVRDTPAGKQSGAVQTPSQTPSSAKGRDRSPTAVGASPRQAATAEESDGEKAGEGKERLAMVVIGHVDAGKSTLMGQLLVQVGQVSQRVLHKHEKEAREAGKASFFLAWVMDENQEERAHGVTIEVGQKYIETETKLVTLLDAPGHRDFIPNMISGASAADAAVLVIPAAVGEFESGFQASGQTKEHAMLAKALGVNQLLVVVNKLDVTDPPWSEARYEAVKAEVAPFLTRTGFRPKKVRFLPASGLSAENVSKRSPGGLLSEWYDGPTLLEAIDSFTPAPKATDKPFRMCVADVTSTGKGVSVSGRVVQGQVRTGEKVVVMPLEDPATATRLERNGAPARTARAGDNAEMTLSGVDAARVVVGNVVCKAGRVLPAVRRFNAQIVALPALEVPVIKGTEFELHMHNLDVMVHCSKLVSLTNTAGEVLKARPRCIPSGSTAHIRITCQRPICLEKYGDCRPLGRFVLRQRGATVAVGLVLDTEAR
eukprot:jgi/Undpi1/1073/HiC_scaffold_10.g04536.m1